MAVNRTVLPRKGIIQSQHGGEGYEADQDGNALLLDSNVIFILDLLAACAGINGVVSGFALSTSGTLTPGLTAGVLFAQGQDYAPASAPAIPAAPASTSSYLFYNTTSGFYWQSSPVGANAGDALIGMAVTGAGAVTSVLQATNVFGAVALAPSASGNFTVPHILGRAPIRAIVQMTSAGLIYWQTPTAWDGTNLYLTASGAATGWAIVF
jgi:hypothetical protein